MFFIIGFPRSGTKVLRELMNGTGKVFVPRSETHILPKLITLKKAQDGSRLSAAKLVREVKASSYRINMADDFDEDKLKLDLSSNDWEGLYHQLFIEPLSDFSPSSVEIIGDKTPQYINHIESILDAMPDAKFIHLVRDPRDCVASEVSTWGKHYYRAAKRWTKSIGEVVRLKDNGTLNGENLLELRYEDLLSDPSCTLKEALNFLGLEYCSSYEQPRLNRPTEPKGEYSKSTAIISSNSGKYKLLGENKVRIIESKVKVTAGLYGYEMRNGVPVGYILDNVLSFWSLFYDGMKVLRYHVAERGIYSGLIYFIKIFSENRGVQK